MILLSNISALFDGTTDSPSGVHRSIDLGIEGERIVHLAPHDPELAGREGLTAVDASGWFVTPGLIDCHAHVTALGLSGPDIDTINGPTGLAYVERILYRMLVDGGVTTARDVGGATHAMKRLVEEGVAIGPRLVIAICMLSTTGGHADFRSPDRCHATISRLWPEGPGRPSSIVDGPWECRKRVREIAACGADLIKICASPGVASPSDHLEHQDFSAEEVRAICHEAEARGLRVAAHAHSRSGLRLAIENGVHDLQHMSFLDDDLAEAALKKDLTVTPTSWIMAELLEEDSLSDFVKEKARKVAEVHAAAVDSARRSGLRILGGTDAVMRGMHGRNWMELVSLVSDGLDPLQAWFGMTGLAAREIGVSGTGELRVGQKADLLICDRDVIADPGHFQAGALVEVVKEGRAHRGALLALPQVTFGSSTSTAIDG